MKTDQLTRKALPGQETRIATEKHPPTRKQLIVTTAQLFIEEYARFIASRNQLLGASGQLPAVRAAVSPSRQEPTKTASL